MVDLSSEEPQPDPVDFRWVLLEHIGAHGRPHGNIGVERI